jgi:DNA-binding CsgD family transcriptional regulator
VWDKFYILELMENNLAVTWIAEMRQIVKSTKLQDVEQRITAHINKCYGLENAFQSRSMFFLFDNVNPGYHFVSKSAAGVLGYSREEIIDNGFAWLFSLLSPAELEYKKKCMDDVFGFIRTLGPEEVLRSCVRFDTVAMRKDGTAIHLLEEMMFPEVDTSGAPLLTSCFLHDLSDYGNSGQRQCTILLETDGGRETVFSKRYLIGKKGSGPLSPREIEVLEQFSQGLNTRQVAERLFVTENTIKTHRKSILFKLNVQNTAEAVKVSMQNDWLA